MAASALGDDESPPFVVSREPPQYPPEALANSVEGHVTLEIRVGLEGNVLEVNIIESDPPKVFDESAKKAALLWRFTPKCASKFPSSFIVRQMVHFKMPANLEENKPTILLPQHYSRPETTMVQSTTGLRLKRMDPCTTSK